VHISVGPYPPRFLAPLLANDTVIDPFNGEQLYQTVEKYVDLGNHRTGSPGDSATIEWLSSTLTGYGYDVELYNFRSSSCLSSSCLHLLLLPL
jgi:hypothetical protein